MRYFSGEKILGKTEAYGAIPPDKTLLSTTLKLAWPSILESFLVSLVGMVDTVMVGTLGSSAIAAVGLTTQPKYLGLALFMSLNVAVSAVVARRCGERDKDGANRVMTQSLLITIGLTVLVSILCVLLADPVIALAGSKPDTHADAVAYFQIIMGGLGFTTISMVICAAQRGAGNMKIAMITNIVSNGVNMVFNYLLIGGRFGFPKLGVKGAAIATVIGSVFAFAISIASIARPGKFLNFHGLSHVRFDKRTLGAIWKVGSGTLLEQLFLRFGFFLYAVIAANLGTLAFAAHQVGMNIMNLAFALGDGLSAAAITLVGKSLGQRRPDMAKIYGGICQRIGVLFSVALSIILITLHTQIFQLFSNEQGVLDYSGMMMSLLSVIVLMQIAHVIYSGCLRGGGDTVYVAFISLISVAIIRPLSGYLLAYPCGLGLFGAWLGIAIDQALRFLFSWLRFRGGRWMKNKL